MSKRNTEQRGLLRSPGLFLMLFIGLTLCGSVCAEEITYDPGKRRDPFVALTGDDVFSAASSSGLRLEGIIYDPAGPEVAILSGKTYGTGETAGEAIIVKIQRDHVVISIEGEEKILWIRNEASA